MEQVTAVIIGAGSRGNAYAQSAIPNTLKIVGVAEPNDTRRNMFRDTYGLREENCFKSYEQLFAVPKMADLAIICSSDSLHVGPSEMAVGKGYHILLEKPIAPSPEEVFKIVKLAEKTDKIFSVCYVLRYTNYYQTLKKILNSGKIGRLVSVVHSENVAYWHQAHSFVRGNWRNSQESSPMILQKCCHDMDILGYLIDSKCKRLSSFGSLAYFKPESAPDGAARRCLDACPHFDNCQYNAVKLYLDTPLRNWCQIPFAIPNTDSDTILDALRKNDYGRCVYYCDNDVVDHQVVNMEFENGVTVAFTMCAFTNDCNRVMRLMGTEGEIEGDVQNGIIIIKEFNTGNTERISVFSGESGHSGGDYGIINSVINAILGRGNDGSSVTQSMQSHMMAFAAEKSRLEGRTVDINSYIDEIAEKVESSEKYLLRSEVV